MAGVFLHNDGKNRSENVMIVDLLRNDLGRVLHETGGGEVTVESLFDVETYESLFQMTSTVLGRGSNALARTPLAILFKGLFPCGSVTGAPKIRTMEIIAELEKDRRGVYCGAIGFLAPDGSGVFNVPIRTIVLDGEKGEMGIGSGVTHGSDSGDEWQECLLKGKFLTDPSPEFQLIETLLWTPENGFLFSQLHLERLLGSAEYFYFQVSRKAVESCLEQAVRGREEPTRVRLTLAKDGVVDIGVAGCQVPGSLALPLAPEPESVNLPKVRLSAQCTESREKWLYHKTTERHLYNKAYRNGAERGRLRRAVLQRAGRSHRRRDLQCYRLS